MNKGDTYRIASTDYDDFYGLTVGDTFTITGICNEGFGWCKPTDEMGAPWTTCPEICILDEQMIADGDVELVNA